MTANHSALDTLLEAAILAPSGDNTQPWRFSVDRERWTITLDVDPARDPSPMNAGQRMARIAVGAALENMERAANDNGWDHQIEVIEGQITLRLLQFHDAGTLSAVLRDRTTNRKRYRSEVLSSSCVELLKQSTTSTLPVTVSWIVETNQLAILCDLIGRADALILSSQLVRNAFLAKVRFDLPTNSVADDGLSIGSLEVQKSQQLALRAMRVVPDFVLRLGGAARLFRKAASELAESASGFCLVTASGDNPSLDYQVGRLFQRSWLALTEHDLASQPMMSLVVLRNIFENGSEAVKRSINEPAAEQLLRELSDFTSGIAVGKSSALLRFGAAASPTVRTGRLPIAEVMLSKPSASCQ